MYDSLQLNNISKSLNEICKRSKIRKIYRLTVIVNYTSHVNEENLLKYLKQNNAALLGNDFRVKVKKENIEDQNPIIHSIQGEIVEE